MAAKLKRSAAEMRLIRSATAYKRLAWKADTTERQRKLYLGIAERKTREANSIRERRERQL